MILDGSEKVLQEACWNGRKEAASSVISVAPRSYFFRSGMGQIKNKDHCAEPRNTAPKFPNDTHIQLLRGREQCPPSSSTTSRITEIGRALPGALQDRFSLETK